MEVKILKIKRKNLKSSLTKFITYIDNFNHIADNIEELKVRLERILSAIDEFDENQTQLELLENADTVGLTDERDAFESTYYQVVGKAKQTIKSFITPEVITSMTPCSVHSDTQSHFNVQLPKLTLQKFDGTYTQWLSFKNNFSSSIHNNETLSNVQKFQYLKGVLQGEASQLISSLVTTNENYSIAWDLLEKRYENQRIIINNHMQAIFELQSITRESSASLRKMLDNFQMHVRALEALDEPVQHWDTLLIYLLSTKLDPWTKRAWEMELGEKIRTKPTFSDLINFLSARYQVLEISESSKKSYIEKLNPMKRNISLAVTAQICIYCKENHPIFICERLLKLSPLQRMEKVKDLRLCINCLKTGHFIRECLSSSTCKKCRGKHNTLLHVDKPSNKAQIKNDSNQENVRSRDNSKGKEKATPVVSCFVQEAKQQVLLATALVDLIDNEGNHHEVRVALDGGSQINFIRKELIDKINIRTENINFQI